MIKLDIFNPFTDAPVYYRDVTDSTMDDSKNASSGEILHGTVFRAGYQEKGRGRVRGREWKSSSGLNLMFTLVLKRSELTHELNHMPLIAGIALTTAVRKYQNLDFRLKWPNDLLYEGKKCAGILCEADSRYFYCGMGVNCNQESFPEDIMSKTVSLKQISGIRISLDILQTEILGRMKFYLESGDLWREHIGNLLCGLGEITEVREGQAGSSVVIRGKNRGIGMDGELILEEKNGEIRRIYAGEIEL